MIVLFETYVDLCQGIWNRISNELSQYTHGLNKIWSNFVDFHGAQIWQLVVSVKFDMDDKTRLTLSSLWSSCLIPSLLLACRASRRFFSRERILSGFSKSSEALWRGFQWSRSMKVGERTHQEWPWQFQQIERAVYWTKRQMSLEPDFLVEFLYCEEKKPWITTQQLKMDRLTNTQPVWCNNMTLLLHFKIYGHPQRDLGFVWRA